MNELNTNCCANCFHVFSLINFIVYYTIASLLMAVVVSYIRTNCCYWKITTHLHVYLPPGLVCPYWEQTSNAGCISVHVLTDHGDITPETILNKSGCIWWLWFRIPILILVPTGVLATARFIPDMNFRSYRI